MAGEQVATKVSIEVGDGATPTEVFAVIPGVIGLPRFPALEFEEIDVTALDSAAKEFLLGLGDPGSIDFTMNLKQKASGTGWIASHEALEGYGSDRELHNFKIKVAAPVTLTYSFAAYVTFVPGAATVNSAITADVSLRVSGAIAVA